MHAQRRQKHAVSVRYAVAPWPKVSRPKAMPMQTMSVCTKAQTVTKFCRSEEKVAAGDSSGCSGCGESVGSFASS